jgi:hypothetical protein
MMVGTPPDAFASGCFAHPTTLRGYAALRAVADAAMMRSGRTGAEPMWKAFWRKWTIDRPAAFGDLLWDVLVVQLAALLDRVTFRDIIAFIPVVILVWAYAHHIPLPPELLLLGDLLAYIDIFSVLFLLGVLSRIATIVFIVRQARARVTGLARRLLARMDLRHRREVRTRNRKRLTGPGKNDDDECGVGFAWA